MTREDRWLLPEGIDEVLPPRAWQLERLRRRLLDHYHVQGYELVMPPFVEFLDSLLIGAGSDLDLATFKLIDQSSGRTLGVRADMTPQVARIDAHGLKQHRHPTRLCYMGTVLHTRGDGLGSSRSPVQVGAEIYGHSCLASDLEILSLLVTTLELAGIPEPHLDLGHVAVFRGLVRQAGLDPERESQLFEILQRKALPELEALLANWRLDPKIRTMLLDLADLNGAPGVLNQAEHRLAEAEVDVRQALDTLRQTIAALEQRHPGLPLHVDLAELRGYQYHTGLVFAVYIPGQGQEIARGGRYDRIGEVFGRARPATGFSADLKKLQQLGQLPEE
ncbi:MAG: ATP phosphoribosyltransferase regulatory subunit, partial [Candidatus Competibacterales bacterium]|nr:ATP phosphoribosyltransferase regulatory subunit [Candidatus Competibacterales bacterium]